jgi:hypothetical protein
MHIEPVQVFYAPAIGVILHYVYWTSRWLWLPMLLHTLNNSLSVLLARWGNDVQKIGKVDLTADHLPLELYLGAVALLAGVGFAFYQCRGRLAATEGDGPPLWQPLYPGVEYPPPGSGTQVVYPRPSVSVLAAAALGVLVFLAMCYLAMR